MMRTAAVGSIVGGVLGLLDGLSAWFYPRGEIDAGHHYPGLHYQGVLTGLVVGVVVKRWRSLPLGIVTGLVVGFGLRTLAALGQPDHYWAIVLPGMLVGALTGIATQRMGPTLTVVLCALSATTFAAGQQPTTDNQLAVLDPFIGRWQGTTEGQPGNGTVEREYTRILNSRFVHLKNRSVYPPQERNPKGEEHEDIGVFSVDRARKRIVFRQFHVEGFVNQYVQEPGTADRTLVFVTEAIEHSRRLARTRDLHTHQR